ncbi:MAG: hypothetical protein SNG49_06500 [Rikenellaceae bacterium]
MTNIFRKLWPFGRKKELEATDEKKEAEQKQEVLEKQEDIEFDQIDLRALMGKSPDDVIDRFLSCTELKIVVDKASKEEVEVQTEPNLSEEENLVSEELAKIYLSQGLKAEAIEIYRKLSLLNSEKSIYFAELIAKLENNN